MKLPGIFVVMSLCFCNSSVWAEENHRVSDAAQLQAAIKSAMPGDRIVMTTTV
jgi:hypothetical protein